MSLVYKLHFYRFLGGIFGRV